MSVILCTGGSILPSLGTSFHLLVSGHYAANKHATAGYDHTIRFWEALSGICSRTIQHPDSQVNRLCISPDKRYLAAAGNHNVKLFDVKSTNPQPVMVFSGHTGNITGVQFHCEGKWMVTSSEDGFVKVWQTKDGSIQRVYDHKCAVNDVVIHPNQGELIACDRSGGVKIWDLGEDKCAQELYPEEDVSMASVTVASDGSLLCAGNNSVRSYPVWRRSTLILTPTSYQGQRLRLAHDSKSKHNHNPSHHILPSAHGLYNACPPLPRRASPGDMQRGPQRTNLERRSHRSPQHQRQRKPS